MKTSILAFLLIISSAAFAQQKSCTLWLGDASDSMTSIKQTAEQYLELQTKVVPNEGVKTVYDMKDDNGLVLIKVWMKPKKVVKDGAMTTIYVVSSFKVVSLADKIDVLYQALQAKVAHCTTEASAESTLFGNNKMFIEKTGGDFTKKNLPMATLTVTPK